MIKVLFVCHGNICRSTMAEFLFKEIVKKNQVSDMFYIESAGTSSEEEGNKVHYETARILNNLGIDCSNKKARKIRLSDYDEFDYLIGMDHYNILNMLNFFHHDKEHKIKRLLDFTSLNKDVVDPYYYGNFNETYKEIMLGLEAFYKYLNIDK